MELYDPEQLHGIVAWAGRRACDCARAADPARSQAEVKNREVIENAVLLAGARDPERLARYPSAECRGRTLGLRGSAPAARRDRFLGPPARLLLLSQPLGCSSAGLLHRQPLDGAAPIVVGAVRWGHSAGTLGARENGSAALLFRSSRGCQCAAARTDSSCWGCPAPG